MFHVLTISRGNPKADSRSTCGSVPDTPISYDFLVLA